ncbi:MAG: HIT family protein [Chloroflexi bacterium]|nr:HIT family protein [Chloroflexota bacterium]
MNHVDFNCIFCAIAAKRAPAAFVYESTDALGFLDIHPITEGHLLIVPRKHCRNLFDIDDASGKSVMHAARVVARGMRAAFNADGMNLFQSSERAGGQDVFHFHFHLLPRFFGDGLMARDGHDRMMRWRARGNPTQADLDAIAEKIRAHIIEGPV